jgi:hypothetical protein
MSPLLGALGDSSEYAYRGTIDDVPADFNFTNITGAEPGIAYTSGPITITGINNKVLVSVSAGASVSVNSGIFTSGPAFIRNGETVSLYTPTTSGSDTDFDKIYSVTATVGKISKVWTVRTRDKDSTPDSFIFANATNQELGITSTSNTITVSGLDATIPSNAAITSGIGSFRKNGGSPGTATTIGNGDTIAIVLQGPTDYSKTNTTAITVGTYTTTYSVSTRPADTTVNQFVFNNYTNVAISSAFDSNSITLSGADTDTFLAPVPLTATVSGGFLKVVRGSSIVRDFNTAPVTVLNGDILTLKLNSSASYSTTTRATLSITGANTPVGIASTFSVTTRPIISDTIVDQFQVVDKTGQGRNVTTISDPITISGITTHADDFARIFLTNNADGGQFRIRRNGIVVRDFSSSDAGVRNGDVVDLRITTSPASEGTVLTNVNIAGTDNTDINNIIQQTRSDTWVVQSARRNCPLVAPTLNSITGIEPSSLQSVTFIPTSYDSDCNVVVNTSNANSYLSVNGTTGNNLVVLPGVACTVFMTAGGFSETRTTTVTLTANNNVPTPTSTSTTWSVTPRSINNPTVTLLASPASVSCNQNTTLIWSSTGATKVTTSGFTGITTTGSLSVGPLKANTTYSITATGTDNTTATSTTTVLVSTTAVATLQANTTSIAYNGSVTLSWATSNASSVVSNFGVTATSGSITLNNLKSSQTYTLRAISNGGCADSPTQSVTVNVAACVEDVQTDTDYPGVTLQYTLANPGNGFDYYYTSLSGGSGAARQAQSYGDSEYYEGSSSASICTCGSQDPCLNGSNGPNGGSWTVPAGVTYVQIIAKGAGGGGGGGGAQLSGGSGGSGAFGFLGLSVTPGQTFSWNFGGGGMGGYPCGNGNTPNNGGGGCYGGPGWPTRVYYSGYGGRQIMAAGGGGGGGRNINGTPGSGSVDSGGSMSTGGAGNGGYGGGVDFYRSGSSIICANSGGQYGGYGGSGSVEIRYTVNIEGASWSTLINAINQQYKSSFNRPPSVTEMDTWINQYINYGADSVSQIQSRIASGSAYRSSTGAISYCGRTL